MGVSVNWHQTKKNVLYWKFTSPWTWNEFHEGFEREKQLNTEYSEDYYHVIADFLGNPGLPRGSGITHVAATFRQMPPGRKLTIVVATDRFIHIMVNMFTKINSKYKDVFIPCQTLEEADAIIQRFSQDEMNAANGDSI
jgi:hypothetical protein